MSEPITASALVCRKYQLIETTVRAATASADSEYFWMKRRARNTGLADVFRCGGERCIDNVTVGRLHDFRPSARLSPGESRFIRTRCPSGEYATMQKNACTPSRQPIFFPSA